MGYGRQEWSIAPSLGSILHNGDTEPYAGHLENILSFEG